MKLDIKARMEAWKDKKILVIGDAMLDQYLVYDSQGKSTYPDGFWAKKPYGTLPFQFRCGGAANVAANVNSLGGKATLLSSVGTDTAGKILREQLSKAKIRLINVDNVGQATTVKFRAVKDGKVESYYGWDAMSPPSEQAFNRVIMKRLPMTIMEDHDAVIVSDYGKGFGRAIASQLNLLSQWADYAKKPIILDPKYIPAHLVEAIPFLKPNMHDLMRILGRSFASGVPKLEWVQILLTDVMDMYPQLEQVVLTAAHMGMFFAIRGSKKIGSIPAKSPAAGSTIGAGDTTTAALGLSLTDKDYDIMPACQVAAWVAAAGVQKSMTPVVTVDDVLRHVSLTTSTTLPRYPGY